MSCEYFFSFAWNKTIEGEKQTGFSNCSLQSSDEFEINGIDDINHAEQILAKDRGYDQVKILYWRKF